MVSRVQTTPSRRAGTLCRAATPLFRGARRAYGVEAGGVPSPGPGRRRPPLPLLLPGGSAPTLGIPGTPKRSAFSFLRFGIFGKFYGGFFLTSSGGGTIFFNWQAEPLGGPWGIPGRGPLKATPCWRLWPAASAPRWRPPPPEGKVRVALGWDLQLSLQFAEIRGCPSYETSLFANIT